MNQSLKKFLMTICLLVILSAPQTVHATEMITGTSQNSLETVTETNWDDNATEQETSGVIVTVASIYQLEDDGDWWIEAENGFFYFIPFSLGSPSEGDTIYMEVSFEGEAFLWDLISSGTEEEENESIENHSMILWVKKTCAYKTEDETETIIGLTGYNGQEYTIPLTGNETLLEVGLFGGRWAWVSISYDDNYDILAWNEENTLELVSFIALVVITVLFVIGVGLGFHSIAQGRKKPVEIIWGIFYLVAASISFLGVLTFLRYLGMMPKA